MEDNAVKLSKRILQFSQDCIQFLLLSLILMYQLLISPFFPSSCRFYPSCSCYYQQALKEHGLLKGNVLGLRRICRCHPGHPGGIDPVPPKISQQNKSCTNG